MAEKLCRQPCKDGPRVLTGKWGYDTMRAVTAEFQAKAEQLVAEQGELVAEIECIGVER